MAKGLAASHALGGSDLHLKIGDLAAGGAPSLALNSVGCHALAARPIASAQERPLLPPGRSRLFQRNLDPAIHAFFYEREIDHATEFVRNEIAYEIGAVAGLNLGGHRRTSKLAPLQDQGCLLPVRLTVPTDRYLPAGDR